MYFSPQHRREPQIRLFRANWLEALTRVSPWFVTLVWAPVIVWFAWQGWVARDAHGMGVLACAGAVGIGLLLWTLTEYALHRFVFHFTPKAPPPWVQRLVFLFHGIHHVQPWDKQRLVMPPAVSIPLAALFRWLFARLFVDACGAPGWLDLAFAGFLAGYLCYDLLHYATHHVAGRAAWFRWLKRHHLLHHHATPEQRFGVSSPLWDLVLGTMPREAADLPAEPTA